MKIILLTDGIFPDKIGGMQKHSAMLLKNLLEQGHELLLVSFIESKSINKKQLFLLLNIGNESLSRLKFKQVNFPKKHFFPGHYVYESYLFSKRIYRAIKHLISDYDFVYAQGFTGWYLLSAHRTVPIGVNFHGLNMFQTTFGFRAKFEKILLKPFVKHNLKNADYVFSLGGKLTEILLKEGIADWKIIEQYNGVDSNWLVDKTLRREDDGYTRYLFVGRQDKIKGLDGVINVFRKLSAEMKVKLLIVGTEGTNTNKIEYYGQINDEEQLKSMYIKADVLLLNSYSEGMPTVILEAMIMGKPILSSHVGAIEVLVSEENGMLFSMGDENDLKKSIIWFYNLPQERRCLLGKNSKEKASSKFTWRIIVKDSIEKLRVKLHEHPQKPDLG